MKGIIVGVVLLLVVGSLIAYRRCGGHRDQVIKPNNAASTKEWVPTEAELADGNQGVGWVFGRMIGVSDAPGSPNHSPFGAGSPGHCMTGVAPQMRR